MSILNTTNPTDYFLEIPDHGLTKTVQLNVQTYTPPTLILPPTDIPSAQFGMSRSYIPSTVLEYRPVTMSILLDKYHYAWQELYQWMMSLVNYDSLSNEYIEKGVSPRSMFVHYLDNHHRDIVMSHEFTHPFPMALSPPTYDHTISMDYPMACEVTFAYHTLRVLDKDGNQLGTRLNVQDALIEQYDKRKNDYEFLQKLDDDERKFDLDDYKKLFKG